MSATQSPPPPPTKEEADMTQSLAQDRPTIDAAIKSYVSLVCAKALTASATDQTTNTTAKEQQKEEDPKTLLGLIPSAGLSNINNNNNSQASSSSSSTGVQQEILQFARILLQTLNQYTFPIHCTVANTMADKPSLTKTQKLDLLELSISAQLWNGLVQSNQKPSRFLGRKALRHAWKHQLSTEMQQKVSSSQQQQEWFEEFEGLLWVDDSTNTDDSQQQQQDNDAALLWAPDGGANELAKRQSRRAQAAKQRSG